MTDRMKKLNKIGLFMDTILAVGFGEVTATKSGICIYSESDWPNEKYPTVQYIEEMAIKEPGQIWKISFYAPLGDEEWERINGTWVCIEAGDGFA